MKLTTTYTTNANGTGKVVAKADGKQRTVTYDHKLSAPQNHAQAAWALVSNNLTDEQLAKLRHPSGMQRVTNDGGSPVMRWTLDV